VSGLKMNYEKIDAYKKIAFYFGRSTRMTPNVCLAVGLDTWSDKQRWSICHHKSGDQIASLHTYHAKAETVVRVRRNSERNEVAQGREAW
jgi:hypothetical protein